MFVELIEIASSSPVGIPGRMLLNIVLFKLTRSS